MEDSWQNIKTTAYFREQVLRKRPYVKAPWCLDIIQKALHKEIQIDGRIRYWGFVEETQKYLRVVTLSDGTLHNAFFDRNFKGDSIV